MPSALTMLSWQAAVTLEQAELLSDFTFALARELVMSHGWNANCYQILNPGINHWFDSTQAAVIGYTRRYNRLLVAGAPICPLNILPRVCAEFEAFASRGALGVCYVCAEERLRVVFGDSADHATVALGAQPAWDPRAWERIVQDRPSLRAQLNRSRNKSVVVEELSPEQGAMCPELDRILAEWLRTRNLPTMRFLVEPDILHGVLSDRILLTARCGGAIVAYLVASPIPARNGFLVELLARSPAAPNGTSELLISAAMERFTKQQCAYATLGLVALTHAADDQIRRNPLWLRAMMTFARAHANRFYNFRGLEHFRMKMIPDRWETVYAISNERRFSARTLYALGAAFSGMSPLRAVAIGAARAIRQEVRHVAGKLSRTRL